MLKKIIIIFSVVLLTPGVSIMEGFAEESREFGYVGSEKCGECHLKAFKSWEETKLARALIVLGPKKKTVIKKEMGLDPAKDYTKETKCLKCHTTGYKEGKDGSYAFSEYGIGCEACHGPGERYAVLMKSKGRNYERKELIEAGMIADFTGLCENCHNEESPVISPDYKFSHSESYGKAHIPVELKYHRKIERFKNED